MHSERARELRDAMRRRRRHARRLLAEVVVRLRWQTRGFGPAVRREQLCGGALGARSARARVAAERIAIAIAIVAAVAVAVAVATAVATAVVAVASTVAVRLLGVRCERIEIGVQAEAGRRHVGLAADVAGGRATPAALGAVHAIALAPFFVGQHRSVRRAPGDCARLRPVAIGGVDAVEEQPWATQRNVQRGGKRSTRQPTRSTGRVPSHHCRQPHAHRHAHERLWRAAIGRVRVVAAAAAALARTTSSPVGTALARAGRRVAELADEAEGVERNEKRPDARLYLPVAQDRALDGLGVVAQQGRIALAEQLCAQQRRQHGASLVADAAARASRRRRVRRTAHCERGIWACGEHLTRV